MTREEAICELSVIWERLSHPEDCENGCYSFRDGDYLEALDMAIEALSAEAVQGEWIECLAYNPDLDADVPYIECDQCGHIPYFGGSYRPKYCEECGARMTPYKGGDDE